MKNYREIDFDSKNYDAIDLRVKALFFQHPVEEDTMRLRQILEKSSIES